MSIKVVNHGSFKKTRYWMEGVHKNVSDARFEAYAEKGLKALKDATPVRTGKTRDSWTYKITREDGRVEINWYNTNMITNHGKPISVAVFIDQGHGRKGGGFVKGRNFISPAIRPVFDDIANDLVKKVKEA